MIRTLVVLGLLAAPALPAAAQTAKPKPPAPLSAQEKQLLGTWEGPYTSEQAPPGGLRVVITRDTTWKLTVEVVADEPIAAGEVRELKVEGNTISWVQDIMEMVCKAQGAIVGGTLKGETHCEQGGQVAITANWVLLKK